MNICFDVGNSTIGIGVYKDNVLAERMTFNTDVKLTEDEFYHLFKNKINELEINLNDVKNIIYSSVVPQISFVILPEFSFVHFPIFVLILLVIQMVFHLILFVLIH